MPNSRIAGAGGWLAEKTASATSMSAPSSKADHPRAAGDRRWPCSFSRTSRTPSATWSPWVPYGPDRLAQPVEPSTAQPCSPSSSPNRTEQSRSLPGAPSATQHADAESSAACPFHHPAHDGAGYPGQTEVQAPGVRTTSPDCRPPRPGCVRSPRSFGCVPRRHESLGRPRPNTASCRRCSSSRVRVLQQLARIGHVPVLRPKPLHDPVVVER